MIQRMKKYTYSAISDKLDEYGQPITQDKTGEVLMAISVTKHSPVDSPLYVDSEFTGITQNKEIDETYIINYDNKKLKVLYVIKGRFNQVFMQEVK